MLPILSVPSPALQLHASNALLFADERMTELPPHAQLRSLLYAVRWEASIDPRDWLSEDLEGERWLVWAAGNVSIALLGDIHLHSLRSFQAEEVPAALLLAHAALLTSVRKQCFRRAALWYVTAAKRLEKCGIVSCSYPVRYSETDYWL